MKTLVDALNAVRDNQKAGYTFINETGPERKYTYAEVCARTERLAAWFAAQGFEKGDRISLILPEAEDFVFSFLACLRLGVVAVPMYPPVNIGRLDNYLKTSSHILQSAGARAIVTRAQVRRVLGTLLDSVSSLREIVTLEEMPTAGVSLACPDRHVRPEDLAFLQFTSGSTSQPKGVALTHANLVANITLLMEKGLEVREGDVGVSWLPLYHDMGLIGFVLAPLCCRIPVVYLPPLLFLKKPARWLKAMSDHKGTIAFAPNFAYGLCTARIRDDELDGIDLSAWRVAGCGAEPIRAETLRGFIAKFSRVGFKDGTFMTAYGMAEASLAISFGAWGKPFRTDTVAIKALAEEGRAMPTDRADVETTTMVSCGKSFPGQEVRVVDAEGRPLPDRSVGELVLKGPSVMSGYYGQPEATARTIRDGWLHTGDLGYMVGGEVYVCGRHKDLIIFNGKNYYPQDLEAAASALKSVRKGNVAAFSVNGGERDREKVVVVIERRDTEEPNEMLQAAVRDEVLAVTGLRVDEVVVVGAGMLPKTSSGKLQRSKTRDLYVRGELTVSAPGSRFSSAVKVARQVAASQWSLLKSRVTRAVSPYK
ncbi:MAG: fatty acyl-AMP ligase [Deltaproteobacteria bacterium]|nr:fatty acyl-AMP ligase [Deltaproteobacteria bacterium]